LEQVKHLLEAVRRLNVRTVRIVAGARAAESSDRTLMTSYSRI